jgi:hypothetical protein
MKSYLTAGAVATLISLSNMSTVSAQTGPVDKTPPGQGQVQLPGTEWAGSEKLNGYGVLRFQFLTGGKAFMIDKDGKSPGRYVQNGLKVSLSFYDDKVLYVGTISGQTLSGSAQNGKSSWTFEVTLQGSPAAAPTAKPAPAPANAGTGPTKTPVAPIGGGNVTTGPVSPGPVTTGPAATGPATGARLTPEELPAFLRKLGYQVKPVTPASGPAYCVLTTKNDSGWTFIIEVRVVNNTVWMVAPLSELPASDKASTPPLLKLLAANDATAPCFFVYRPADNRICLKLEVLGGNNDNGFRAHVTLLCNTIQQSFPLWNRANLGAPAQFVANDH